MTTAAACCGYCQLGSTEPCPDPAKPLERKEVEGWPTLGPMNLDKTRVLKLFNKIEAHEHLIDALTLEREKLLAERDQQTKRLAELHNVANEKCSGNGENCPGCALTKLKRIMDFFDNPGGPKCGDWALAEIRRLLAPKHENPPTN